MKCDYSFKPFGCGFSIFNGCGQTYCLLHGHISSPDVKSGKCLDRRTVVASPRSGGRLPYDD